MFELFSLAVSAINGCGTCMASHEQVVTKGGVTEDQVHDAVRIAATVSHADYVTTMRTLRRIGMDLRHQH